MNKINRGITKVRGLRRISAFRGSLHRDIYFDNELTEAWDAKILALENDGLESRLTKLGPRPDDDAEGSTSEGDEWDTKQIECVRDAQKAAMDSVGERPPRDCVRIHKAKARQSIPVGTRLLSLVGNDIFQLMAHDDEDDPDGISMSDLMNMNMEGSEIKSFISSKVIPLVEEKLEELTDDDKGIVWMFETILNRNVEIDGERLTFDELDELASITQITKMFWAGISLALFPGRGDPATRDGSLGPGSPPTENQAPTPSNLPDGPARATGQSARTSMQVP